MSIFDSLASNSGAFYHVGGIITKMNSIGTFFGVGVGPGDPELLTVKAINAIKSADVVIAPKTEKKEGSVALSIAMPYILPNVQIVYQTFPMVQNFTESSQVIEHNKDEILNFLKMGKNVAFLTLGDPMFYSTYIYIFQKLRKFDIKIKTIPGVPSFLAISSYVERPLSFGDDILTVIPSTADSDKIQNALKISDVTVLMKVYKNFDQIVEILKNADMADDAVLVSRCGLSGEKIIDNIEEHKLDKINYLSTILTRRKNNFEKSGD